jgi:hypothetical protein
MRKAPARRWLRATLGASAVLVLATLARADAPMDQYNLFNLNSDVIQDLQTGLYWQRYPPATAVDFNGAAATCAALSLDTFASGWRVPSYKELLTLVDESPHVEYDNGMLVQKFIDGNAFPGAAVTSASYWTSSAYPPAPASEGYAVDFHSGEPAGQDMTSSQYVRCVH